MTRSELDELLDTIVAAAGATDADDSADSPQARMLTLAADLERAREALPGDTPGLRQLRRALRSATNHASRLARTHRALLDDIAAIHDAAEAARTKD